MNDLELPAAQWLKGVDYTGLVPGAAAPSESAPYAVSYVAGQNQVRGYVRSQALVAPRPLPPATRSVSACPAASPALPSSRRECADSNDRSGKCAECSVLETIRQPNGQKLWRSSPPFRPPPWSYTAIEMQAIARAHPTNTCGLH